VTNRTYGYILAYTWAAVPGGLGGLTFWLAFNQGSITRLVGSCFFFALGWYLFLILEPKRITNGT
jgi:hypothetical protein